MSFDAGDRLGEIRAPTLVVTGTADVVVDWRNSQLLAERPGARLELSPGAGILLLGRAGAVRCARQGVPR